MTWDQLKDSTIPKAGSLRNAALYAALVNRAQHLVANYTPVIGGVAPGSHIEVAASTTSTYVHPVITPASGLCSFIFAAHTDGIGVGVVTFATSSGSRTVAIPLSATTVATYTITGVPLSGSADRCTVTVQNSAGGGKVMVYGGIVIATTNAGTELDELPPEVEILESGQPITADAVRRLSSSCIYMARKRPPALVYFASRTRAGVEAYTLSEGVRLGTWYDFALDKPNGAELYISFTAATSTYLRLNLGYGGTTSLQGGGVSTVKTQSFLASQSHVIDFTTTNQNTPAPVESFVIYEKVP